MVVEGLMVRCVVYGLLGLPMRELSVVVEHVVLHSVYAWCWNC